LKTYEYSIQSIQTDKNIYNEFGEKKIKNFKQSSGDQADEKEDPLRLRHLPQIRQVLRKNKKFISDLGEGKREIYFLETFLPSIC
jgi:hypothetical protein